MLRPIYIALITSLCFAFVARADDKPSPAVKRILDKAVGKVRANRQEFDKANKKPLDEAKAELQDWAKKLVDDGKAEEAGVVLKQVGTLEADVMKMANAPAPVAGVGKPAPQKPLLERLAGKWTHPNHSTIYHIETNGLFHETFKSDGKFFRQGKMQAMQDDTVEVEASDGVKIKFRVAGADIIAAEVWDKDGAPWSLGMVLTRIK